MSRVCELTNKGVMTGNNVSHAVNRTRRRFLPNLQVTRVQSEGLGRVIKMRTSTRALRTIDIKGGFDAFLMETSNRKLSPQAKKLKRQLLKANKAKA
ncbi:MAG: 50S ribosomal protein L28 [Alphaproteobacteria bacterium]